MLAERVGFEPTVESPLRFFSKELLSTAQSTFQNGGSRGTRTPESFKGSSCFQDSVLDQPGYFHLFFIKTYKIFSRFINNIYNTYAAVLR